MRGEWCERGVPNDVVKPRRLVALQGTQVALDDVEAKLATE